jgi:hypothetical protein
VGHRASDDDAIRVAGRSHELDPEAAEIENHVSRRGELGFTAVAAARRHLAQSKRATEESSHLRIERVGQADVAPGHPKVLALAYRKPRVRPVHDRLLGTAFLTKRAEQTRAKVDLERLLRDRVRGTRIDARATAFATSRGLKRRAAAKTRREYRRIRSNA